VIFGIEWVSLASKEARIGERRSAAIHSIGGKREPHWHRRFRSASKDAKLAAQGASLQALRPLLRSGFSQELAEAKPRRFDEANELSGIRCLAGLETTAERSQREGTDGEGGTFQRVSGLAALRAVRLFELRAQKFEAGSVEAQQFDAQFLVTLNLMLEMRCIQEGIRRRMSVSPSSSAFLIFASVFQGTVIHGDAPSLPKASRSCR
jgi:hypothetical protein